MVKRFVWADLLRIFAIYLIIVIHLQLPLYSDPRYPEGLIITPLIYVCVPIFFMLSGALLLGKSESYLYFFKKRLTKIVFPWILWTFLFTLLIILYNQYNFSLFLSIFQSIFISMFWIMPVIVGLYLLTPSLRIYIKQAKQYDIWFIILLWYVGVSVLPYFHNTLGFPMAIDNGIPHLIFNYLGYFLLGFAITNLAPSRKNYNICIGLFIIGFILSFIVFSGIVKSSVVSNISPGTILLSSSVFACFYFSENTLRKKINKDWEKIIAKISRTTFGVFFVHFLFINHPPLPILLKGNEIQIYMWLNPFLNGLLIYAISFSIILLLQKIPILGKYVS